MAVIIPQVVTEDRASGAKILRGSLRFNSASSHYLNRTPASAGNLQTWTLSFWVKRSEFAEQRLFSVPDSSGHATLRFSSTDALEWSVFSTSSNGSATTNAVFRDPSAWYHIVFAYNTTLSTAADRVILYVNSTRQTLASSTNPTQNANGSVNGVIAHHLGKQSTASNYFNGYLTEINFVDGYAYDPSYFGFTDPLTNTWRPKKYTGEYGTNGFYLPFDDDNAKGTDRSGKGNNWTANNFSGTSTNPDVVPDSPSGISYSTVPTVGIGTTTGLTKPSNYATLNPLDTPDVNPTLSEGNLRWVTNTSLLSNHTRSSIYYPTSGKWYIEVTIENYNTGSGVGYAIIGITQRINSRYLWWEYSLPQVQINTNSGLQNVGSVAVNDIIQVACDTSTGKIWFGKNNTWYLSGDPANGTAMSSPATLSFASDDAAFHLDGRTGSDTNRLIVNFGQRPFKYTPPTGFLTLCTANLPRPTIVRPDKFVGIVTYTGTGASLTTSFGFTPDLIWTKNRSAAHQHRWFDSVRGNDTTLSSNATGAEQNISSSLSIVTNGFTVGTSTVTNTSGNGYVAWGWKAGGQIGVGRSFMINDVGFATAGDAGMNTGTITPTGASVNTKSGFSIVTYTGTGANATISHGLGVAPSMIIAKGRTNTDNWPVGHTSRGWDRHILLNSTNAEAVTSSTWYNTAPTSSVFTVGTDTRINQNGITYVAYLWSEVAGFSKFGSYSGNGSADGTFVFCGFRPRWVMMKRSSGVENWQIYDAVRDTYNVAGLQLLPNTSGAESDGRPILDILSNGFKLRNSTGGGNVSATYIYAAYAEAPAQNLFGGQSSAR